MLTRLGLPPQASAHAAAVDHLLTQVHWQMAVMFIGWGLFFLFVLVRFRQGAHPRATYQGTSGLAARIAIAAVVAEAALIVFHALPVWATRTPGDFPGGEATVVRVVAEQFAWNVQYPGADGQFGRTAIRLVAVDNPIGLDRSDPAAADDLTTINQLVMPVDRPILIHLSSKDVVHSFAISEMRVKHDAVPGLVVPVWFMPTVIGNYEVACSQLCGLGHYRMRAAVSVVSSGDYQAFLADEARAQRR